MFDENTEKDDIAIPANLLSQIIDWTDNVATWSRPWMTPATGTDYGIEDVFSYICGKYGENF